jgi:hypothetical protein
MYTAQSKDLKEELFEIVDLLENFIEENNYEEGMTVYETFKIAVEMQKNRLYADANVLGTEHPSALERISMVLEKK